MQNQDNKKTGGLNLGSSHNRFQTVENPSNGGREKACHHFSFYAQPLLSLIAGVLILIMPKLLNYMVAIYLMVSGILGLVR